MNEILSRIDDRLGFENAKKVIIAMLITFLVPLIAFKVALPIIFEKLGVNNSTLAGIVAVLLFLLYFQKLLYVMSVLKYSDMQYESCYSIFILMLLPILADLQLLKLNRKGIYEDDLFFSVMSGKNHFSMVVFTSIACTIVTILGLIYEWVAFGFTTVNPLIQIFHILMVALLVLLSMLRVVSLGILKKDLGEYFYTSNDSMLYLVSLIITSLYVAYTLIVLGTSLIGINFTIPAAQVIFPILGLFVLPVYGLFAFGSIYKQHRQSVIEEKIKDDIL